MSPKNIHGKRFALTYAATAKSENARFESTAECVIEDLDSGERLFCVITTPVRPSASDCSFEKEVFGKWWEDKERLADTDGLADFVLEAIVKRCRGLPPVPLPRIEVGWGPRRITFDEGSVMSLGIIKPKD